MLTIYTQYKNCSPFNLGMAEVDNGLVINTKNKIIELENYLKSLTGSKYITYKFFERNKNDYSTDSGFIALIHHKSDYSILPNSEKSQELILINKNLKVINRLTLPRNPYDRSWEVVSVFGDNIKLKNGSNYPNFLFWNFKTGSIDTQIDEKTIVSDGLYIFSDKENGFGYKNEKHEIVIQAKYIASSPFKFGLTIVQDIRGQYIIDKTEKIILRLGNKYSKYNLEIVSPSLLICKDNSAYCYNDLNGCKDFYVDLSGYEYRDNEQNINLKREIQVLAKNTKDSINKITTEIQNSRIVEQQTKQRNQELEKVKNLSVGDIFEDGIILTKYEDGSCLLITTSSKVVDAINLTTELSHKGNYWRMPTVEEAKLVRAAKNASPNFKKQFNKGSPGYFGIMSTDTKSKGYWMIGSTNILSGDEYFTTIPSSFWLVPVKKFPTK